MIDFNTIKEKAAVQFQDEWNELQDTLRKDPESQRLADVIMNLRSLEEVNQITLSEILCDTEPASFLRDFINIFDTDEFIRLPNTLDSLITHLRYNILNDGYIRLIKAVIFNDYCIGDKKFNRKSKYFLTTDDDTDPVKLAIRVIKQDMPLDLKNNSKLISLKGTCFGEVKTFTRMLEIFNNKDNWDGFHFIGEDQLETLFCFHEVKEILSSPVPLG